MSAAASRVIAGVFVGGAGTRMGGVAKGLLFSPDGRTLVERVVRVLADAGVFEVVLVGRAAAYASLGLAALPDRPAGIGPLGGLSALLAHAAHASRSSAPYAVGAASVKVLALACDMPFVSASLVARLLSAPDAPVVAPRIGDRWEPLCARYDAALVLPIADRRVAASDHSLQRVLDEAGAISLPLLPDDLAALRDWDTPEDIARDR